MPNKTSNESASAWASFEQAALQATFLDYVHEVEHAADRLQRLEKAIEDAMATAPAEIQEVVQALQALRGIAQIAAVSIVAELGSLSRFPSPRQLMSYSGLDEETKAIAWKAQWRLCTRYKKLAARGKNKPQIVTAIERELLGFIWAIAVKVETPSQRQAA